MSPASSSDLKPWTKELFHSGLVSIGTHKLWLSISGPPNRLDKSINKPVPNELVIFFTGAGDFHGYSWGPVSRIIQGSEEYRRPSSEFSNKIKPRILLYDRSGLGESERGPRRLTATNAASELLAALQSTGLMDHHESLILVAHSYGAIIARKLFHLLESKPSSSASSPTTEGRAPAFSDRPEAEAPEVKKIKALVLADPSTENIHRYFDHPNPDMTCDHLAWISASVTDPQSREKTKPSRDNWGGGATQPSPIAREIPPYMAAYAEEVSNFIEACTTLGERNQLSNHALGSRPLVVIYAEKLKEYDFILACSSRERPRTAEEEQRLNALRKLRDRWEGYDREISDGLLGLVCPPSTSASTSTAGAGADLQGEAATTSTTTSTSTSTTRLEPIRVTYGGAGRLVSSSSPGPGNDLDNERDNTRTSTSTSTRGRRGTTNMKVVCVQDWGQTVNSHIQRPGSEIVAREIFWALEIVRDKHMHESEDGHKQE